MLSFRDLEVLPKFAPLLAILLFTAALMMDLGMLDEHFMPSAQGVVQALDDSALADWALNNSSRGVQVVGWGLVFACLVYLTLACISLVKAILCEIQIHAGYYTEVYLQAHFPFLEIVSLACMMGGFLFIVTLVRGSPLSLLNPFWYFGLICYGFYLLDLAGAIRRA